MGSPWAISSPLRRAHDTSAGRDLIGRSHCHAGPQLPAGVRALEKDPTGLLPISRWAKSVPTESLRRLVPCHADPARAQCCSLWLPCAWRRARPGLRGGTSPPLRAGWGSSPRRAVSHWPHGSLRRRGSVRGRLRPPRGGWAPGVARTAEGLASARRGGSEDPHAAPAPLHRRHLQRAPSAEAQRRPHPGPSLSSSTNTGLCASVKSWFEPGSACSCLNCPSLSLLVCKTRSPTASWVPRMGDVDPKCRASSLASQSRGRGPAPGRP